MTTTTTPALQLENLGKRYGKFELGPINLNVPRGAVYALIGPNGAGKTTTLDLLMGMGRPDLGKVRMLGLDLDESEVAIKKRTAYVSPELHFHAWGKVGNALDFVSGFYPDWDDAKCTRLLTAFGLNRAEKIAALSFGSRIKLSLVVALSRNAELLLLDEPTVGLDAVSRQQLFSELLGFMQQEDRTIIISSHQLSDLERFADHVGIVHRGKLLLSGRMDELVERYRQLDVQLTAQSLLPVEGVRILHRDNGRARLLLDRTKANVEQLTRAGVPVLADSPLTLEEIFLALVKE